MKVSLLLDWLSLSHNYHEPTIKAHGIAMLWMICNTPEPRVGFSKNQTTEDEKQLVKSLKEGRLDSG